MDSDIVIQAEGLGKKYLIGHQAAERHGTLRDALVSGASRFARMGSSMLRGSPIIAGDEIEEFWALKDVNFEIRRGDVVGVIGRNGAGKSTLLKLLSRITEPSEGRVFIGGRVASLLEVGTGFHPELSGRENIYLNGAILGMNRSEISRKFAEIVEFAEIEKFLDTPVKRYSSGMYVRLAFAVAAHLEPEVLIVDEVLAVGDSEFQKKCIGKMKSVAGGGRTVLFVSHNIRAISELCESGIFLSGGKVEKRGDINSCLEAYGSASQVSNNVSDLSSLPRRACTGRVAFQELRLFTDGMEVIAGTTGKPLEFRLKISTNETKNIKINITLSVRDLLENVLIIADSEASTGAAFDATSCSTYSCTIPRLPLTEGEYLVSFRMAYSDTIHDWIENQVRLSVKHSGYYRTHKNVPAGWEGKVTLVDNRWSKVFSEKGVKAHEI